MLKYTADSSRLKLLLDFELDGKAVEKNASGLVSVSDSSTNCSSTAPMCSLELSEEITKGLSGSSWFSVAVSAKSSLMVSNASCCVFPHANLELFFSGWTFQ